jgi:hypothetical protein
MKLTDWKVFGGTVELEGTAMQIDHVDFELVVRDTTLRDPDNKEIPFLFTDVQFQPGHQKTGWVPNTQEMLDRIEFDVDEMRKYDSSYNFKTVKPRTWTAEELGYKRLFNIMGRGHEKIVFPNDLPEEKFWRLSDIEAQGLDRPVEILTTGIDLTLIPKDDYDLCRISTEHGSIVDEEEWPYYSLIEKYQELNPNGVDQYFINNPLNTRYSREFWFTGGSAGDILEVTASKMVARKNGAVLQRDGIREITAGGRTITLYKNKFHLIPRGSVRFKVEFYKTIDVQMKRDSTNYDTIQVLQDTGIGYTGTAVFNQWTYGVERL